MAKNKTWSAAAKLKIALHALKSEDTINETCTKYDVSPRQVHAWKKQLLEQGEELFKKKNKQATHKVIAAHEEKESRLFETIGQLKYERDFLKKSLKKLQEQSEEDF